MDSDGFQRILGEGGGAGGEAGFFGRVSQLATAFENKWLFISVA